ncbi:MAG: terminase small subunit [Rhodocyclaceae bacterium]|nr:terminase small subunit [Rhodocyclaceae bacterium]
MIEMDYPVTQAEFAKLVGISQQAVSDLAQRSLLAEGASAQTWLLQYTGHLREVAAGRLGANDHGLVAERARLAKEQADRVAMQNAITRREIAPVGLLEEVLARVATQIAKILETIPKTIRTRAPDLAPSVLAQIESDIADARNLAASLPSRLFKNDADQEDASEREPETECAPDNLQVGQ